MGMRKKRCPKCKKKRRFVDVNPSNYDLPPIDPIKEQTKHDAGWRLVDGQLTCGWCCFLYVIAKKA
jgi:hypothetical protein